MDQPYRAAPTERPIVALREFTAPLGVCGGGRLSLTVRVGVLGLLGMSVVCGLAPLATELACTKGDGAAECALVTRRGLFDERRMFEARGVDAVPTSEPDLGLTTRGIYRDPRGVWHHDDGLARAARDFFQSARGGSFAVLETHDTASVGAFLTCLLTSFAGLAMLLRAERSTRCLSLSLDPNARTARGRSVGLGGATVDRTMSFGADARLHLYDDANTPCLPLVRVSSAEGASPPLLAGRAAEHRETLDRLTRRANRALAAGTVADRSPSLALRVAPSLLLALALAAVFTRVVLCSRALPATAGTVALTCSTDRCETEGVTLLRGGQLSSSVPVGLSTRAFSVAMPGGATRTASVIFEVAPGRRTAFDCARLRADTTSGRFRATPDGVRPDDASPDAPPR